MVEDRCHEINVHLICQKKLVLRGSPSNITLFTFKKEGKPLYEIEQTIPIASVKTPTPKIEKQNQTDKI